MKRIGIVSYNIYCNFTNYGSALQSWALHQAIKRVGGEKYLPVLVDYCPDILADKDPLNPFGSMWDKDEESRRMCELSLPAIRENFVRFDRFYRERFDRTSRKYTSANFNDILSAENLDGFVCGSDTIFCISEFGFDDGYYAEYDCMKGNSVAYAASFGDPELSEGDYAELNKRLLNFKAIGLRENSMLPYVQEHTEAPAAKVIDPTLLLTAEDYDCITALPQEQEKYLLLYARRYNPAMEAYAERVAAENGWKIVEISLRATNAEKQGRRMFYEAGVEEFLSLVKNAEFMVTNSFHGIIFAVQFRKEFCGFVREQCGTKIYELIGLFGLKHHLLTDMSEQPYLSIDYDEVHTRIEAARVKALDFLKEELELL